MNPSSRGPVCTMDSGYSRNREFFYANRSPVHTKHRIRPPWLSYIIPERIFFLEFYSSKRILENLGNFRGKIDKFENFRAIWAFTWHFGNISRLNVDKTFFFLYSYRPREGSVRSNATAVSKARSTEHNKSAAFHQSRLYYNLSAVIHQKGPSLSKKSRNFLRIFWWISVDFFISRICDFVDDKDWVFWNSIRSKTRPGLKRAIANSK